MSANHRIELPQGTLDLLILQTLVLEPQHGWAISERVQQISSDVLCIQQGSLYPALHRLERRGWIKALGRFGKQPARQVLRAHQERTPTARSRERRLGKADGCDGSGAGNRLGDGSMLSDIVFSSPFLCFAAIE
jgi:hypothetical protein